MKLYLDTSLAVSLLAEEVSSARVRNWIFEQGVAEFMISWWVETEVASAFSKKVREGRITTIDRDRSMQAFELLIAAPATMASVGRGDFKAAERYCLHEETGLGSGDALHLAVATANDATLCTLDKRLADAGSKLNLPTILV